MELHFVLLTLGGLFLVGLMTDEIGRRTRLPRVTLLIIFGIVLGPSGLDLLPAGIESWYELLASMALTMVAFLLGGRLSWSKLHHNGREILYVSFAVVAVTVTVVFGGLAAFGMPVVIAMLLAGIATATAPAATQDVVRQTGASGPFTDTLLGIVAIDDAWGLIAFSLILIAAKALVGDGAVVVVGQAAWDLGGSLAIGAVVGLPAAYLTGRLSPGEPTQAEALGLVFLCAGLSLWIEVSFLLAGMVAGLVIVNLAHHHSRPFHEIEHIEWPFMVLFFVLAGATLHVESVAEVGLIGGIYIALRTVARVVGARIGGRLCEAPPMHQRWMGLALMPQAGVAIGMALVAGSHFPALKDTILTVTIGTTVLFEIFGPVLTQTALRKAGETRR